MACRTTEERYEYAQQNLAEFNPKHVFLLPTFLTSFPQSVEAYNSAVRGVLNYYQTLTPSREVINVDAQMFQGEVERQLVRTENKTETRTSTSIERDSSTELKAVQEKVRMQVGNKHSHKEIPFFEWGHKTEPIYADKLVDTYKSFNVEKTFTRTDTFHDTLKREVCHTYKVLAGNLKIFMAEETGQWDKVESTLVSSVIEELE